MIIAKVIKSIGKLKVMERANGIEPSTLTLARLCSTAELRPHIHIKEYTQNQFTQKPIGFQSDKVTRAVHQKEQNSKPIHTKTVRFSERQGRESRPLRTVIVVPRVGVEPTRAKPTRFWV